MELNFSEKSLIVITGASRGIGKSIAINTAKKLATNSTIVLLARNQQHLNDVKEEILKINSNLNVISYAMDLTNPSKSDLENIFNNIDSNYTNAVLIHNAGSMGEVSKRAIQLDSFDNWQNYLAFNFISVATLTSVFVTKFRSLKLFIVNITSLIGRQAFASFSQYGPGKAARDMYFKVLALEEEDIKVLSYSPGPCETDMATDLAKEVIINGDVFKDMVIGNKLLDPNVSVGKMLNVLECGCYKSGDIVDYYDKVDIKPKNV